MTWKTTCAAAAALGLISHANAEFAKNGDWSGYDVDDGDDYDLVVEDGVVYSDDSKVQARIDAGSPIGDSSTQDNVKRFKRVFPETKFKHVVPEANDKYSYAGLVEAVTLYPAFCGENKLTKAKMQSLTTGTLTKKYTNDEACKREISALFAHINQETGQNDPKKKWTKLDFWRQGLYHLAEYACTNPNGLYYSSDPDGHCDYTDDSNTDYPPEDGERYYGRGPLQLSWNYNLGPFSQAYYFDEFDGKSEILEDPDKLLDDSDVLWASAMWFYMTPQSPKPSMHEVMAGIMEPNSDDALDGYDNGFGTTINIINGGLECGSGLKSSYQKKHDNRGSNFTELLNYFGLPEETADSKKCTDQTKFNETTRSGWGKFKGYLKKGDTNYCEFTNTTTAYSVYTPNDYKRCVCDSLGYTESVCEF